MPREPHTPVEYWDTYMPYRGEGEQPAPVADRFEWTQYPGHGPGAEMLGQPRRALDLGPAEGKEAVYLARQGVEVTGVDLSPAQVRRRGPTEQPVTLSRFPQVAAAWPRLSERLRRTRRL